METKRHIGNQIRRMRELRGMKQDAMAVAMGVSQQTVSHLENNEYVDDIKLKEVAKALGVNKEAIKNFSDEAIVNYFNNFHDNTSVNGFSGSHATNNFSMDAIDKLIGIIEENKILYNDNEELYKSLLQAEKDKVLHLEKLLGK